MGETQYRELFLFAAKVGALEGYLYERQKVEPLANWVGNISRMYRELSPAVKGEVNTVLAPVLEKALEYGDRLLDADLKEELKAVLAATAKDG